MVGARHGPDRQWSGLSVGQLAMFWAGTDRGSAGHGLPWSRAGLAMGWTGHGQDRGRAGHGLGWPSAGLAMGGPAMGWAGHVLFWAGHMLCCHGLGWLWAGLAVGGSGHWLGCTRAGHGLGRVHFGKTLGWVVYRLD
jgi:hypothetical protein